MSPNLLSTKYEQVSDILGYLGHAPLGSAEEDPVWRIRKIAYDAAGGVDVKIANGVTAFDSRWTDRSTLTYL